MSLAAPSRSSCESPAVLQQNCSSGCCSSSWSQTFPLLASRAAEAPAPHQPVSAAQCLRQDTLLLPFHARQARWQPRWQPSLQPAEVGPWEAALPAAARLSQDRILTPFANQGQLCGWGEAHRGAPGWRPRCTEAQPLSAISTNSCLPLAGRELPPPAKPLPGSSVFPGASLLQRGSVSLSNNPNVDPFEQ